MPLGRVDSIHITSSAEATMRDVALNHLVGREFTVGEVRLRGSELCEPCASLARMTGRPEILPGLVHRGGLRAEILQGDVIRVGDLIGGILGRVIGWIGRFRDGILRWRRRSGSAGG